MSWSEWANSLRESKIKQLQIRKEILLDQQRVLKEEITQLSVEIKELQKKQKAKDPISLSDSTLDFHC